MVIWQSTFKLLYLVHNYNSVRYRSLITVKLTTTKIKQNKNYNLNEFLELELN